MQQKSPVWIAPPGLLAIDGITLGSIRQHSLVLTAAMLVDDPLAGLLVDLVSLPAGFGYVFGSGFVAVAE